MLSLTRRVQLWNGGHVSLWPLVGTQADHQRTRFESNTSAAARSCPRLIETPNLPPPLAEVNATDAKVNTSVASGRRRRATAVPSAVGVCAGCDRRHRPRLPQAPSLRLPEDRREFIAHCASSNTDRLVIQAVVGIARGLAKSTIAEFVGDDETARLLTRLGVDYGQGYHLGRPAPISDLITALAVDASPRRS